MGESHRLLEDQATGRLSSPRQKDKMFWHTEELYLPVRTPVSEALTWECRRRGALESLVSLRWARSHIELVGTRKCDEELYKYGVLLQVCGRGKSCAWNLH